MTLATIYSRAQVGVNAPLVTVETHLSNGLPGFSIVGLPEAAVRESKERVRSALLNSFFEFPPRRITVNLAPADLPKQGGRFDLPIALGVLACTNQIPHDILEEYEFAGELALTGDLRAIKGALPFALGARASKRALILPFFNAKEAALPGDNVVYGAKHLLAVCAHLRGKPLLKKATAKATIRKQHYPNDMKDVMGQQQARRALEIAAAGGHNLLLVGPPGTGKTMLATRLPSILPELTNTESLEVAALYSLRDQQSQAPKWKQRPYRAPHHSASGVALVGGGSNPKPGEISLAHNGVLFLDELPEFDKKVLEALREPLESKQINISRSVRSIEFPAKFQLIAAMNPCPCGYWGDTEKRCRCSPDTVQRYVERLSGPLLDRIDLHVMVPRLPLKQLACYHQNVPEESSVIRERVAAARKFANSQAQSQNQTIQLTPELRNQIFSALDTLGLSARAYNRVLRVARTIANLEKSTEVEKHHLIEAMAYRQLERVMATAHEPR